MFLFLGSLKSQLVSSHKIISLSSLSSCLTVSLRLSQDVLSVSDVSGLYQLNINMLLAFRRVISNHRSSNSSHFNFLFASVKLPTMPNSTTRHWPNGMCCVYTLRQVKRL